MIVLSGPTQVPVPAPALTTDPGYQSELASIKTAQASLTDAQKTAITYWSAGGVLRWNEILRELVARADLPPAPNADGSYPVTQRRQSLRLPAVSLQQSSLRRPRLQLRRRRPVRSPQGRLVLQVPLQSPLALQGRPLHPVPHALHRHPLLPLRGRRRGRRQLRPAPAPLSHLRRRDQRQKAAEQQQAALLSGRATPSDIAAGIALGQAVAAIFTARAATDGMKAAAGNATIWQALADSATARGEIPWRSQDSPPVLPCCPSSARSRAG